jgi:tyrosyl-tRNA synthetase
MPNLIETLKERGFVEQTTHEQEMADLFDREKVTGYIGFDPTASSLHIGSLVPIMSLAQMQKAGHRPIALVGGGTGLVGDPSGKTEMRQLLTREAIDNNAAGIKKQLARFIDFSEDRALMVNNADWLTKLEYIPFLRDIGRHFSVNRMLRAESYKMRLDSDDGLNFIEFNYMLLQAYDFLVLRGEHDCKLQMGGSDQWGNIVAGIDLVRRVRQEDAYGITFPLITTSAGAKMGKTAAGAVWLDPDRTSPYDYYQYWINTDDRDVERFMALFTFLPMDEIKKISGLNGADLNIAKVVLAFEATGLAHGQNEAHKAFQKSAGHFGSREVPAGILPSSRIHNQPTPDLKLTDGEGLQSEDTALEESADSFMVKGEFEAGIPAFKLFHTVGLTNTGSAARRLIDQGGAYLNARRVDSFDQLITVNDIDDNFTIVLRAGKKRFHRIRVQDE